MIPGVTYIPVASTTVALRGASSPRPTAAILPLRIRTSPPSIVPFVTVMIVALRISVTASSR